MNSAHPRSHRRGVAIAVIMTLVIALAALMLTVHQSLSTASPSFPSPAPAPFAETATGATAADGLIEPGVRVTVFDDVPAVTGLDDALRAALQRGARAAASDGVELRINSGWRSPAYQRQLRREAEVEYGSAEEAARWVATADTSEHVSGEAVDVGPWEGADWLGRHGAQFGLCRVYANEAWHFELRAEADTHGCPSLYADPTARRS